MLDFIKEHFKRMWFKENVGVIDDGITSIIYLGNGVYVGELFSDSLDSSFTITNEGDYSSVKKELLKIPFNYADSIATKCKKNSTPRTWRISIGNYAYSEPVSRSTAYEFYTKMAETNDMKDIRLIPVRYVILNMHTNKSIKGKVFRSFTDAWSYIYNSEIDYDDVIVRLLTKQLKEEIGYAE